MQCTNTDVRFRVDREGFFEPPTAACYVALQFSGCRDIRVLYHQTALQEPQSYEYHWLRYSYLDWSHKHH